MRLTAPGAASRVMPVKRSPFHRLIGFVALATFVLSFVSPLDAIGDLKHGDDAACGQSLWFGGHPDTRFETGTSVPQPQHCPYCHFLRAVSGASPAETIALVAPSLPVAPAPTLPPLVSLAVITDRPSRAPPSAA